MHAWRKFIGYISGGSVRDLLRFLGFIRAFFGRFWSCWIAFEGPWILKHGFGGPNLKTHEAKIRIGGKMGLLVNKGTSLVEQTSTNPEVTRRAPARLYITICAAARCVISGKLVFYSIFGARVL